MFIHNRRPAGQPITEWSRVLQKVTQSRQLSPSIPPASQGAIQKESKITWSDTTQCKCSSGSHTKAVARIACSNRIMTGIGSCRLSTSGFPRTECSISSRTGAPSTDPTSEVMPGAARTNWARSSIKVSRVSSESTRRHGGPTPRTITSKATLPKKSAGNLQPAIYTVYNCCQDDHLIRQLQHLY